MKAIAPGKIIISGEHAVVYGKPALVMAIDRFSRCTMKHLDAPRVKLNLPDFSIDGSLSWQQLENIHQTVHDRYQQYLENRLEIDRVITSPQQVFIYLLMQLLHKTDETTDTGFEITLTSQLVPGGGTGSSASTIMCALRAGSALLQLDLDLDDLLETGIAVENLLHGRSSGVDPWVCLHGGFNRFQNGKAVRLSYPEVQWYVAFSGKPKAGTGESVSSVRKRFAYSMIWSEFEQLTLELETAINMNDFDAILECIRINHQLLCRTGVVPGPVRKLIQSIENQGGAAKISGAGSVRGDCAGAVLICDPYNVVDFTSISWPVFKTTAEEKGARII